MTPTTPHKAMNAPQTVIPGGGVAATTPKAPAPPAKKKPILAIVAIIALVVAVAGGIVLWKTLNPGPPSPLAPTEKLVPYIASKAFLESPPEKKMSYFGPMS